MKQFLLILTTLIFIAIALVVFARRGQVTLLEPRTDVIRADDGVLYVIQYFNQRIVVLLPREWDNISSRTTTNSKTKSLDADVDLYGSGGTPRVNIQFHSSSPSVVQIDDRNFDLGAGGIFLVEEEVAPSGAKQIIQAPFNPLESSREYLTKLRQELDK